MAWIPQTTTLASCADLLAQRGNLVAPAGRGTSSSQALDALTLSHLTFDSQESDALTISHLSYDSQNVLAHTLFFCKGAHFKPEYLAEAVSAGAIAYVSECDYTAYLESVGIQPVPVLLVREIRPAIAEVAALFYRGLLERLTLIGFTGTKGKSTTTYMFRSILDSWLSAQGKAPSAWLSSIENYDGVALSHAYLTTQDVLELYAHFKNAVDSGIEYLTLEVSSQALKYGRTQNLRFEVAGFLNIGEDHISPVEHVDHEDYLSSKLSIFKQSRIAVINRESDEFERAASAAASCERVLAFGHSAAADVAVSEIGSSPEGLSFLARTAAWQGRFTLPMAGLFNVDNALAALTAACALDIPLEHMQQGLATCEVNGRMQLMAGPDNKLIIIDYAHNKMSFETVFATVASEYPNRPIVCVFGATGTKGAERRKDMPAVAVQYAETIYITEDDPCEEPLEQINQQIAEVVEAAGGSYVIIEDRSQAIERALWDSPAGSVVLILGKGHEIVMKRGIDKIPIMSDRECVLGLLQRGKTGSAGN